MSVLWVFCAAVNVGVKNELSEWLSQELSKTDRPDLSSANMVVSGGELKKQVRSL